MTAPDDALAELLAGNARFVNATPTHPNQDAQRRASLATTQTPFAVIFGCSDSRLAAEIIFDRGLGDLFVVRTAGHVAGVEVLGSIEYAVDVLNTPLVVVLGHNSCGAIRAASDAIGAGSAPPGHLGAVVDAVVPSVNKAAAQGTDDVDDIVDIHISRTVDELLSHSALLSAAVAKGQVKVVGISYHLEAGEVNVVA